MLCKVCGKLVTGVCSCLCCGYHHNHNDNLGIALPDGVSASCVEVDEPPFDINEYIGSMNAGGAERNKPAVVGLALTVISMIYTVVLTIIGNLTNLTNSASEEFGVPIGFVAISIPASLLMFAGIIVSIVGLVKSKKYHNGKAMALVGLLLPFVLYGIDLLMTLFFAWITEI